jgi:signal transduction histidine kinase
LLEVLESPEGLVFDVSTPVLEGTGGTLKLGILDRAVTQQLSSLRRTIIWSFLLCSVIGACLAVILTQILIHPIHHLVRMANRIRKSDFEAKAKIHGNDEIGHLAGVFNQMAAGLQEYRSEVEEKERTRQALIERLVNVQEEERKNISLELHDQIGQSISAALLSVQENCNYKKLPGSLCDDIENRLRQLIDDVHRLAWQMRPPILDDYGLDSALRRHLEEISKQYVFSGLPRRQFTMLFGTQGRAGQALFCFAKPAASACSSKTMGVDSIPRCLTKVRVFLSG